MFKFDESNNKNQSPIMQPLSFFKDEALKPDLVSEADFKSIPFLSTNDHDSLPNGNGTGGGNGMLRAFLFMDADEQLHIATPELFCKKLKCGENDKIKVISIFGNTGDGKSHTMNHVFFDGEQVFKTSPEQNSCTIGVYAAMQPELGVLCLDTEGLLGTTAKSNRRMRMLLKILAISDIVIYRTRSERLHSDMYEFLGTASKAFCLHFSHALQNMGNGTTLGPAVIIFHETRFTKPLESSVEESAEDKLRESFTRLNYETSAFSSLRYVGIQTDAGGITNFSKIIAAVRMEIENTSVRSPRQPCVVFKAMKLLNQKFAGEIIEKAINPFPEQYFTCPVHCESCSRRCQRSMGHVADGETHLNMHPCNYQHLYENKVYLCKACYNNGKEIVVTVRAQTQTDSSWYALAKYAWKGAVIECPQCGEIYRARQYWYGNKSPEAVAVRSQIVHVWKCNSMAGKGTMHSAQMVVDSVSYLSETITNISAPSAKALSGWLADKVAPSYWKPNHELIFCCACKRNFDKTGLPRHHCRGCGEGFCHACSQHKLPVPARGWSQPVRVCNDCYQELQRKSNSTPEEQAEAFTHCKSNPNNAGLQPTNDEGDILVRKYGETLYNTISNVAAVALEYPKEIIKDSARPSYWVPDAESPACFICKLPFGNTEELAVVQHQHRQHHASGGGHMVAMKTNVTTTTLSPSALTTTTAATATTTMATATAAATTIPTTDNNGQRYAFGDYRRHHCRRCGLAVCTACSKTRMPVPERGWQTDVRVCDSCACVPSTTTPQTHDMHAALAAAINSCSSDENTAGAADKNKLSTGASVNATSESASASVTQSSEAKDYI